MSTHSFTQALFIIAVSATLAACSPSDKPPTSLFWDVPPPSASTDAVLVASAAYIGDLFAEAEQRLQDAADASEPAPSF